MLHVPVSLQTQMVYSLCARRLRAFGHIHYAQGHLIQPAVYRGKATLASRILCFETRAAEVDHTIRHDPA